MKEATPTATPSQPAPAEPRSADLHLLEEEVASLRQAVRNGQRTQHGESYRDRLVVAERELTRKRIAARAPLEPGDRVSVINSTMSGTFFLEGEFHLVEHVDGNRWRVRDARYGTPRETVERFIDRMAQEDPAHFVADLNDSPEPRS